MYRLVKFSLLIELLELAVVSEWLPLETASSNSKSWRVASANNFLLSYKSSSYISFFCLATRMADSFCFLIFLRFILAIR